MQLQNTGRRLPSSQLWLAKRWQLLSKLLQFALQILQMHDQLVWFATGLIQLLNTNRMERRCRICAGGGEGQLQTRNLGVQHFFLIWRKDAGNRGPERGTNDQTVCQAALTLTTLSKYIRHQLSRRTKFCSAAVVFYKYKQKEKKKRKTSNIIVLLKIVTAVVVVYPLLMVLMRTLLLDEYKVLILLYVYMY